MSSSKPTGALAPSFSLCAQHVAPRSEKADRSSKLRLSEGTALASPGGQDVRSKSLVSLLAAALITVTPFQALAQTAENESVSVRNRPRPETDPLGKRVGGFTLFANLDLGLTSTDNLFAAEVNEQDDIYTTIGPSVRLRSNWSRHQLEMDAGAEFRGHQDFSNEDADTNYAGIRGRLDIGSNSNVSAMARIANEVESRFDPDAPVGGDPVEYDRTEMALRAEHTFNRFRVSGTLATSEYDYEAGQNFRDNDETRLTGRVEAAITPRISLVLQASQDERDYDNFPALNSEGQTILAGATVNLTELLRGEVTVGQFERDYDNGATVDGTAIAANMEWYVTRLTTVTLDARRDGEDTGSTTAAEPYVATEIGARVDHELLRNVILSAGVRMGDREYEGLDRDDEFRSAQVGATYIMNRRVELNATLGRYETESTGADRYRDYDATEIRVGVSLRL